MIFRTISSVYIFWSVGFNYCTPTLIFCTFHSECWFFQQSCCLLLWILWKKVFLTNVLTCVEVELPVTTYKALILRNLETFQPCFHNQMEIIPFSLFICLFILCLLCLLSCNNRLCCTYLKDNGLSFYYFCLHSQVAWGPHKME